MTGAVQTDRKSNPTDSQKAALLKLLADEDAAVYHTIRNKILSFGQNATPWVQPHTLSSDPVLRRRAVEIVQYLARQSADNSFLAFCLNQGEDFDIEEGAFLLAQTQYPEINLAAYQALLDSYASDLRERIDFGSSPQNILATINQYLFLEKGFYGNEQNFYEPDNSYLNRVIDRRTGNPISLCMIFYLVARRLRLPVVGIGVPLHFFCRFQTPTHELFIDAFHKGKILDKADCIKYLQQSREGGFKETYLSPLSSRRILLRMCYNLHLIYSQLNLAEEKARFQRYMVALAK